MLAARSTTQTTSSETPGLMEPGQRVIASLRAVAFTGSKGVERIGSDGSVELKG